MVLFWVSGFFWIGISQFTPIYVQVLLQRSQRDTLAWVDALLLSLLIQEMRQQKIITEMSIGHVQLDMSLDMTFPTAQILLIGGKLFEVGKTSCLFAHLRQGKNEEF